MKFDDVLTILGDFGRYQKLVFVALCQPLVLVAMQVMSPVFTLATPKHRCAIPNFPNDTFDIQNDQHRKLVEYFIPAPTSDTMSGCNIYDREVNESSQNDTSIRQCDRWVYDTSIFTDTVITETNLVCHRTIYKAHATTALNIGSLFGYLVMGPTADRFGRKMVYMAEVLLMFISATLLIWLPSIYLFIFIRGLIGFGLGVFYQIAYVYAMEFIGPSKRTVCGMMINYFWAAGLLIQTGMAYGLRSWRHLQLAMSLPFLAFFAYWWVLPESSRWLLSKQKYEKGRAIIKRIASVNCVTLNSQHLDIDIQDKKFKETGLLQTLLQLFKNRALAISSCIVFLNWCVVALLYHGLSLNVGNLGGNLYLNFAFSAVVEAVAYTVSIPGIVSMGRKKFHCTCMLMGGVTLLLTIVPVVYDNTPIQWLVVALAMVGKMVAAAAYATVYLFTAELFPTVVRSTTMGVSAFFASVGGMFAPYIVVLGDMLEGPFAKILPLLIFGVTSMVAGLSALILPETGSMKLPDTLQDIGGYSRYIRDGKESTKPESQSDLNTPQQTKATAV